MSWVFYLDRLTTNPEYSDKSLFFTHIVTSAILGVFCGKLDPIDQSCLLKIVNRWTILQDQLYDRRLPVSGWVLIFPRQWESCLSKYLADFSVRDHLSHSRRSVHCTILSLFVLCSSERDLALTTGLCLSLHASGSSVNF